MKVQQTKNSLLGGIQILDLSDEKASFCTKLLADIGARVIKIERPGGDPSRKDRPFGGKSSHLKNSPAFCYNNTNKLSITLNLKHDDGKLLFRILADFGAEVIKLQTKKTATGAESNTSAYFSTWNRNKKSITLDISRPGAKELTLRLVAICDVVVENFSPRVMPNWGLTFDRLKQEKPDIIMLSMSGMGQTGPWKDFVAYGPTLQALGGLTHLTGRKEGYPVGPGYAYADSVAGIYGAFAVLVAPDYRTKTGIGQYIDLSEYEAVCTLVGPVLLEMAANDTETFPLGSNCSDDETAAPHGCYKCLKELYFLPF